MHNHYHFYSFHTNEKTQQNHKLFGHTDYMIGIGIMHFHFYSGTTSFNGHLHSYYGFTGFPKKTENGHKHKMCGKTDLSRLSDCNDKPHAHEYQNYTFENIQYINSPLTKKVLS